MSTRELPLNRCIGLFDSDCLEPAFPGSFNSMVLTDFSIRERMRPKAEKLDTLYEFAKQHDLTIVFTQCCSASRVKDNSPNGTIVVPIDSDDQLWVEKVNNARLINIEKRGDKGHITKSTICRYFDAFQHNSNALKLFDILNIPQWIIFGHGFDLCVDSSAKGLIFAERKVHYLTDVSAPSATGVGPYGTEESGKAILEYLTKIGVTSGTLQEFIKDYS
jgi:nicotinamidase-related amidase